MKLSKAKGILIAHQQQTDAKDLSHESHANQIKEAIARVLEEVGVFPPTPKDAAAKEATPQEDVKNKLESTEWDIGRDFIRNGDVRRSIVRLKDVCQIQEKRLLALEAASAKREEPTLEIIPVDPAAFDTKLAQLCVDVGALEGKPGDFAYTTRTIVRRLLRILRLQEMKEYSSKKYAPLTDKIHARTKELEKGEHIRPATFAGIATKIHARIKALEVDPDPQTFGDFIADILEIWGETVSNPEPKRSGPPRR